MKGITHAAIGANAVWIPAFFGLSVAPWLIVIGAFAALLPDLDASESRIKHLKIGGRIGGVKVGIEPLAPVAMVTSGVFGHRGFMHSLVILAILIVGGVIFFRQSLVLVLVVIIGYASHLLSDMLTKSGIEFFWPIRIRVGLLPKFLRVRTGGVLDNILLLAGAAGVVFFLYNFIGQNAAM